MINFKRKPMEEEPLKGRKRGHMNDDTLLQTEPTTQINPGDLKNFIKNVNVIELLNKNGIMSLFPIQYSTYHLIYKGSDIRGKDRTGSGKTLAFALPIIQRLRNNKELGTEKGPRFLVVLPTRELVLQVTANIEKLRLTENEFKVVAIYGGQQKFKQEDKLRRGADVIVATPGRLIDFANNGAIDFSSLKVVCLDEADEMLKQGFQEDVEKIFRFITQKTTKPQTLLFSATFPTWVNELSAQYQSKDCPMIDLIKDSTISIPQTITNYLLFNDHEQLPKLVSRIKSKFTTKGGRSIIFCETKREVNEIYRGLKGENCAMLSGDVPQCDRQAVYRDFKSGRITTVVATNVAARGLDFPDIEVVVQIEPPRQVQSYIHRAGRTGRAGKKGVCVLVSKKANQRLTNNIERQAKIRFEMLKMNDLPAK